METSKMYLGDSVYVEYDGHDVRISTNNGEEDRNTIYLNPDIIINLLEYLKITIASSDLLKTLQKKEIL